MATGWSSHTQSRVRALRPQSRIRGGPVLGHADRAMRRLTLRQRPMLYQGKHPNTVVVAMERTPRGHPGAGLSASLGKQAADEGRNDPKPPRYRHATGTTSVPGSRRLECGTSRRNTVMWLGPNALGQSTHISVIRSRSDLPSPMPPASAHQHNNPPTNEDALRWTPETPFEQ